MKTEFEDLTQNPYPFYEEIRAQSPIHWGEFFGNRGWYITGYEEASMILKDLRFQNRMPLPETTKWFERLKEIQKQMVLYQNPPDHRKIRRLVNERFTPKVLERYVFMIEETAEQLFSHIKNDKKLDFIADFAFPLASTVIARLLGVPERDKDLFRRWALTLIDTIDLNRSRKSLVKGNECIVEMVHYFKSLILNSKRNRKNDLISVLVEEQNNDKLTEDEVLSTCILLLIAGHETTVNLISNAIYCLATNQEQQIKLREEPLLLKTAIEEVLRYESPTQLTARIASTDVIINQTQIKKGDHIYLFLGACNRDPKNFPNANTLDFAREPNPHLSFGAGIHFCLGSELAKIETKAALRTILKNTNSIQIDSKQLEWRNLTGFRALKELPVVFN
ncbi:cytochrome P450 [Halalkalibacter krulwichiae]|uniref:Biotin biosynthesis cytochrome P450 n=1 Tax=Halalkalibacter krulwichiae TaxID=199441 RepID=A0A1X9MEJ7_9BACI|nr:cytochrome P450 [Halalkalibacter krulwichiae]ARK28862.1 Biotin biosynthesis cytochrome P450 [Halalkalibacter krulwichiae]